MRSLFDYFWHRWLGRPYKLSVSDQGGSGDVVILLHGVGADGRVWGKLGELLESSGRRVIIPDLLGFGSSPKPQWIDYSVQDHSRAVVAAIKKKGVHKGRVIIVGHSMGCLIATHIASAYPGMVQRLVLYEPPLYADDSQFRAHMKRRKYYFSLYEFIASHPQLAFVQAQLLWRFVRRIVGLRLTEEEWIPFQRSLRNTIMRQTAYKELHNIKTYTDIIHGRLDVVVTRADLRDMYRSNKYIKWHAVTDVHGISQRSARYMFKILDGLSIK